MRGYAELRERAAGTAAAPVTSAKSRAPAE